MKNSVKLIFISFLSVFFSFGKNAIAQDCSRSQVFETLSGNNIKASIPINGNLFWTENSNNQFEITNSTASPPLPSTFFTTGIWVAAKNNADELKLAAASYQNEFSNDFFSGPIHNNNGQLSFQCEDFDRTWQVFGHEILQHLSDFANNGIIDNPLPNIYAYPAHQNPHFEVIHGFALPNTPQGLAPFSDQNNDGIYNPDEGDFPLPEGVATNIIPKHIIWGIFNDGAGTHTESYGEPMNIEVQLTAYSFYCNEDGLLNNSIFTSHKIINRGNETLDSLIFTKFVDFDLGCYTDDYMGSIPDMNTFYAYNQDAVDGTTGAVCNGGVSTFGTNPPVQAVTFLNKEMNSFIVWGGFEPQAGTGPPVVPLEYYNYMNGKWANGSPLTYGGDGFNGTQPVSHAFPDNPNDPNGWSYYTSILPYEDNRIAANCNLDGPFAPNDLKKIDIAYTFYKDPILNNVETVDLVYDRTPELQQLYDNGFGGCDFIICPNDCVWTGDANRDSIVTTFDFLQIGLAHGQIGIERDKPLVWLPFDSEDWGQNLLGVDLKHTDCNGSGMIGDTDFAWVNLHFGNTYKLGSPIDEYLSGTEISIMSNQTYPMDQYQYGTIGRVNIELNQAEDIYGLAFTLEFDTTYLKVLFDFEFSPWDNQTTNTFSFSKLNSEKGSFDYAFVKKDGINSTTIIDRIAEIRFTTQTQNFELVQTYLRIKNIRAVLNNGDFLDYGAQDFLVNINNPNGDGQILSNENLEEFNIQIFPNPTSDILNIKIENPSLANFSIFNIYGKKVLEKMEANEKEVQLSASILSQGVYFLKIEMEGKEFVQKFIKM